MPRNTSTYGQLIDGNPLVNADIISIQRVDGLNYRITAEEFATFIGAASGITSINGDTTTAQIIAAGTGLDLVDAGATHTFAIDSTVVTLTGAQTLTNKIITSFTNTVFSDAQHMQARNASGISLSIGDVVFISGYNVGQDLPEITKANADSASTMPAIGIVNGSVANNADGEVCISGRMSGIDTSSFTAGDAIYVSTTAGVLTNVKPTGANLIQNMGVVLRSHASMGVIEIVSLNRTNDLPNIADGDMWIGNGSAVPTAVTMSGDIAITNAGVTTIQAASVDISMLSASGSPSGTTFLRGDNVWATPGGSGDMVLADVQTVTGAKTFGTIGGAVGKFILAGSTSGSTILNAAAIAGTTTITLPGTTGTVALLGNKLSAFAATTSAELAGVISDETGSGLLVFGTSPTIVTPTVASFTNATHDHADAAGGGTLLSTTALSDTANIAYLNTTNTYTAGDRQNFLGLLAGTSGLNVGGIAGNPTTQVDGDVWYNSSTNTMFGRINGTNIDLGAAGAGAPPFADTTSIVEGSVDPTKELRFEVDGLTTATVRVITMPDADITLVNSSDGLIVDAQTGTFTTTKITTTSKSLLNSAIVYTDQTNTFGDFAQIFPDNQLFIQNPAATATFQISAPGIAANRTLTLPLLLGNDIMVTEAFAQTLTNKVMTAAANTFTIASTDLTDTAALGRSTDNLGFFAATTSAQLLGVMSDETGSGLLVFGTSPTLVTPALGVPSALTLTNATGLPPAGVTGVAAVQTDNLSVFAATTSLQLLGVISDETGSGALVFGTSPTIVTPTVASFANAAHDHADAAGGAQLTNTALTSGVFAAITGLGAQSQNLAMGTNLVTGIKSTQYVQNTITYNATLAFNFDGNEKNQLTLTGVLSTLTTSNRAAGKSIQIFIVGDSSDRVLTFNTSWKTNPSDATVTVTANTFGVLSLYCRGTAETDVFAVYAEFS